MDPQALVDSWRRGRASVDAAGAFHLGPAPALEPAARLRAAYGWILENAIHASGTDIGFGASVTLGAGDLQVEVHSGPGWSSFLLLPLLNLVVCRRLLFVGAPGRGKTSVATLMAALAGASPEEVRRSVQRGHPQLTAVDLLGSPLPADLVAAQRPEDVRVAWRRWLTARVKIVDEYNRIPTKTQSALLSLMAEGYAEQYEQTIETGRSSWYLTANDDLGGGTFPVIEALRDRIDVLVRCTPFDTAQLEALLRRMEAGAEAVLPRELVLRPEELDEAYDAVLAVAVPAAVQESLAFFLGQLDFCRRASVRIEHMTKDTLHLAGRRLAYVCTEDCPLDKETNLCTQAESGVSARAWQSVLHFAKALAWFRGEREVAADDVAAVLPWVLHDKLVPNPQSAWFQRPEHQVYLVDRVGWIRQLSESARVQQAAWSRQVADVVRRRAELSGPLEGLSTTELARRVADLRRMLEDLVRKHELTAPLHAELMRLRALLTRHQQALARRGVSG